MAQSRCDSAHTISPAPPLLKQAGKEHTATQIPQAPKNVPWRAEGILNVADCITRYGFDASPFHHKLRENITKK